VPETLRLRADRPLVDELRRFARGEGFDKPPPPPDRDPEALDFRAASEFFAPVRKLVRHDLDTLRLVTAHQVALGAYRGRDARPGGGAGAVQQDRGTAEVAALVGCPPADRQGEGDAVPG
jgi:hypothetical protein